MTSSARLREQASELREHARSVGDSNEYDHLIDRAKEFDKAADDLESALVVHSQDRDYFRTEAMLRDNGGRNDSEPWEAE